MTDARVRRGRDTEDLEAEYLLPLFPGAVSVGPSLSGRDILNTSTEDIRDLIGDPDADLRGLAPEVKARRKFEPKKAMDQAKRNAGGDMPMVVLRLDGQGEAQIDDWLVIFTNKDARELIGRAYGLGEYSRTPQQSSTEEPSKSFGPGEGTRLGSNSDNSRYAVLSGVVSTFLHDLGILSSDEKVQISRRKG